MRVGWYRLFSFSLREEVLSQYQYPSLFLFFINKSSSFESFIVLHNENSIVTNLCFGPKEIMEFYAYPSRFSMSSLSLCGNFFERVKEFCNFAVSAVIGNIFSAIFTFFFALGSFFLSFLVQTLCDCSSNSH